MFFYFWCIIGLKMNFAISFVSGCRVFTNTDDHYDIKKWNIDIVQIIQILLDHFSSNREGDAAEHWSPSIMKQKKEEEEERSDKLTS